MFEATEEKEVKTDKQGRVIDAQGRPLRFKGKGKPAYHGKDGSPHPRQSRLEARQRAFDDLTGGKTHLKRPGSYNK